VSPQVNAASYRGLDPERLIPATEYRDRQDRARAEAERLGLAGLVVYSRGGGPIDMSADVFYLANHYSQQPYMSDHVGIGRARSHGVLIIPVTGPTTLIVDVPWWRRDLVVADAVRPGNDVTGLVADAMGSLGLASGRVGVVGTSSMTAAAYLGLVGEVPSVDLVRVDDLVERLRIHKSPSEVIALRAAIALGVDAVRAAFDVIQPGVTEADAAAVAAEIVAREGGVLYDAACASGVHADQFTWARVPSSDARRPLAAGDIFHMDCYGAFGGYFWDFGRTRIVGDEPTESQRGLVETAIEIVDAVCAAIRPGVNAREAHAAGAAVMAASPVIAALPPAEGETEGFPAVGHGIGLGWEGPWLTPDDATVLEPGMAIAVETIVGHPSVGGGFFEENGIVTDTGFDILTSAVPRRWW
jgi:Xaa-Pro aminopeptidase